MKMKGIAKMNHWQRALLPIAGLVWLTLAGCGKDHDPGGIQNPRDPNDGGLRPPIPSGLDASIASRSVTLSWELGDSTDVQRITKYRVYRRFPTEESPTLADSAAAPPLTLRGLRNGQRYELSVASVLDNGLEGKRSDELAVVPAVFGIVIEDGRAKTRNPRPALLLEAPEGTTGMQLANTEDVRLAPTVPFSAARAWELLPGDGEKIVYVRFLDLLGNPSSVISDTIELDTRAEIRSVAFSPTTLAPGQTLHVELDAGESNGRASIQLGSDARVLELRDDGLGGDSTQNDGLYELDYLVEENLELQDALVRGSFTDQAENEAADRLSTERLNVHRNPDPVVLSPITSPSPEELLLTWSQATDATRFDAYRIYRAEVAGVDTAPTRRSVETISDRTNTTFTDRGLDPSRTYYYRVYVLDPFGNEVSSNERSAKPTENVPPASVTLQSPLRVGETSISLSFSRSQDPDFQSYRIYRGEQQDLDQDPNRRLLATATDANDTNYEDSAELEENFTYYYEIHVVDDLGASAKSNTVSARTQDRLPSAVTIETPSSVGETAILLGWSENQDRDFARYEVRRALQAGVSTASQLLATLTAAENTSYLDTGLTENTEYFYRVFIVDRGANLVGSNEITQTTSNADPSAVTLNAPSEVSGAQTPSVTVTWTASSAHDFEAYRIYRDTSPAVSESSTLVRTVDNSAVLSFTDSGLEDNTRYYYRVFVRDDAAGTTGSNEQSMVTANRAPRPVTLSVSGTTTSSISLSWTQNNDDDFVEYRLLQGTNSSSFPTVVSTFTQREQTGHTVFVSESDSTVYFFKVEVYDQSINSSQRLKTDSNVVSGQAGE